MGKGAGEGQRTYLGKLQARQVTPVEMKGMNVRGDRDM